MTTGQLPFRSSDRETLLEMQRTGETKNPRLLRQDLPDAAERIIVRLLQKKSDDRFRDGHHLQEEGIFCFWEHFNFGLTSCLTKYFTFFGGNFDYKARL